MLQALGAFFVMVSAISAALAVRDTRRNRDESQRDQWRREFETRLDALSAAIVDVGEAALKWREAPDLTADFETAQLRLARARLDALNPWIDLEAIDAVSGRSPSAIDRAILERALNDVANNVDRIRDESRKSWRERKREFRRQMRGL